MMTLDQLQTEIKEWSFRNFKDNRSKANTGPRVIVPSPILDHIAPLLGLVEEFGEFDEAAQLSQLDSAKSKEDVLDAIGDMSIYLLDFCWRDGMTMTSTPIGQSLKQAGLAVLIGKLAHVVLKRHQGIRGYDDYTKYDNDRRERVFAILFRLNNIVAQWYGMTLLNVIENTWSKVKQRDWEKNKKDAHELPAPGELGQCKAELAVCEHKRTEPGKESPRVYGSWLTEVCKDCGMFRTTDHHGAQPSRWRFASEYAKATAEVEDDA